MNIQVSGGIMTPTPNGIMSTQCGPEQHPTNVRPAARSLQPDILLADKIEALLEDVRIALDRDLSIATKAAERLAALLASKLPRDRRSGPVRGGLAPWQRRKVEAYIAAQIEDTILIKDLAELVSLSPSHFSRAFKESFGESPRAFITTSRIARARELMQTTSESLSQIALACGLLDQSHLCRVFRKVTGTSPGAWRRNHAVGPVRRAFLTHCQSQSVILAVI